MFKKKMPEIGSPEWEALCKHCGECCPSCEHKDKETKECIIYEDRHRFEPRCCSVRGFLLTYKDIKMPKGCGYRPYEQQIRKSNHPKIKIHEGGWYLNWEDKITYHLEYYKHIITE